jgi:hypothetical protein
VLDTQISGIQALEQALLAAERNTKRTAAEATEFAAVMFAKSAAANTPMSRKKYRQPIGRTDFDRETRQSYGLRGQAYLFAILRQPPKATTIVFARTKQGPLSLIPNRGLGKRSWGWMLKSLGSSPGKMPAQSRGDESGRRKVYVKKDLRAKDPGVLLVNRLTYLETAAPGLVNMASQKAANTMMKRIERGLGRSG